MCIIICEYRDVQKRMKGCQYKINKFKHETLIRGSMFRITDRVAKMIQEAILWEISCIGYIGNRQADLRKAVCAA